MIRVVKLSGGEQYPDPFAAFTIYTGVAECSVAVESHIEVHVPDESQFFPYRPSFAFNSKSGARVEVAAGEQAAS